MALAPTVQSLTSVIVGLVKQAMNPDHPTRVTTVHPRRRFWRDRDQFAKIYQRGPTDAYGGKFNGWQIYRLSTRPVEHEARWLFYGIHLFELEGLISVQDDPDKGFFSYDVLDIQGEAIRSAVRLSTAVFGNMELVVPDSELQVNCAPFSNKAGDITCWRTLIHVQTEATEVKSL